MMDLAVRVYKGTDDNPTVDICSFDIDADDDGKARDYGHTIIEGGQIVGDGTLKEWDSKKIRQFLSLIEHAPELYAIVKAVASGTGKNYTEITLARAKSVLADIEAGDRVYAQGESWDLL